MNNKFKYTLICVIFFLTGISAAINLKQIAYLPKGIYAGGGFVRVFDTNHNGLPEVILAYYNPPAQPDSLLFYEYRPVNKYEIVIALSGNNYYSWDIGYIDNDNLTDIIVQGPTNETLRVYESGDYNSYPESLVWIGYLPATSGSPSYITDLDRDGEKDILTSSTGTESVFVFENTTDNQYDLVFTNHISADWISTFAIDDFDRDSFVEFVTADINGDVILWECIGDNQYEVIFNDSVIRGAAYDNILTEDMDGDSKPEFIVSAFHNSPDLDWTCVFTFFEATGNNAYQKIFIDSIVNIETWPSWWSASYSGDVDGDGLPEAVLAVADNWFVYKATGNNTFQRIYQGYPFIPGPDNGRERTSIYVNDVNGNGYAEIIESGILPSISSETKIWEIEAMQVLYPNGGEVFQPAAQETIRWRKFTPPGADSFELLISYDNGQTYQTITTGITGNDSSYLWTVPDTASDSSLIGIKAFGPGIGWDESDSVFRIGGPGIDEMRDARYRIQDIRLYQNEPNPFASLTTIKYQIPKKSNMDLTIYNITGQSIRTLVKGVKQSGYYMVKWDGRDETSKEVSSGIYFYRLKAKDFSEIRKMILMK